MSNAVRDPGWRRLQRRLSQLLREFKNFMMSDKTPPPPMRMM